MAFAAAAAQKERKQGLQIGDRLPDVTIQETLLGNSPAKSTGELRGKPLLLDFWGLGCTSCLKSMPHLDSMQRLFGDKLQIIMVCNATRDKVGKYFEKLKQAFPSSPMIINDSVLHRLFPHMTVPHHVWIDRDGIVRSITYDRNATADNLAKFIAGKDIHFSHKAELLDFNAEVNLYEEGGGRWNKEILYHTLFSKYMEGAECAMPQWESDTIHHSLLLRFENYPIRSLFQFAYNKGFAPASFSDDNRIDIQVSNTLALQTACYVDSLADKWNEQARFSYEAVIPGTDKLELFEQMQKDLNFYSPYTAALEKRRMECLVLVDKGSSIQNAELIHSTTNKLKVRRRSGEFTIQLLYLYLKGCNPHIATPIINEAQDREGGVTRLTASLEGVDRPERLEEARKVLHHYGLDLVKGYRDIDILVIKDKNAH
jgi:thiol-disulfide isomerase/thioredoxin